MRKRFILVSALCAMTMFSYAQKVDFDMSNRQPKEVTEDGYQSWAVSQALADTARIGINETDSFTVIINAGPEGTVNRMLRPQWNKALVTDARKARLVGDAVAVLGDDGDGNTPELVSESATINLVLKEMSAGHHTMLAYMNCVRNKQGETAPIDVFVDGKTVLTGVKMTCDAETPSAAGQAYIEFDVAEGKDVTISFVSKPEAGVEYLTTGIYLNGLVFDQPNPKTTALDPTPANADLHFNADEGSTELTWTAAAIAVKHQVYMGTSEADMTLLAETSEPKYKVDNLTTHNTYYWRVDEVDADGNTYQGETWTFRPRRDAFPGAEGYGRYAIGGRGGVVYHVTSLEDYVEGTDTPIPGTFRYGIKEVKGPRTIIFDVEGTIQLKSRLTCSDPYVTIAGQTAPGKGILFRSSPLGVANDGITRFVRLRLGYHNGDTSRGLDGMGMAGNNHSIMDHCSVGWTIDEAFSSRNSWNITLQRTLISEALSIADHPNYGKGTDHGYAATIGGQIGSYHHNLLAHNSGRNWSMGGGMSNGEYAGANDIFNNVCYNWKSRATDGGTHEGQFVGNYYKMGPSTSQKKLLRAQIEGTAQGTQKYYVTGNIREELDGTKTQDKYGDTYEEVWSAGQEKYDPVFVDAPFYDSQATVQTAELAYKSVLSDVGANQPFFDEHDVRMVNETLTKTTSKVGSVSGNKGLVDRETDSEGFGYFPVEGQKRAANYDTDQDGMPDWWEEVKGTNPDVADNNEWQDPFGYTNLEQYLNWIAEPNYIVKPGETLSVDLTKLFAGYDKNPWFTIESDTPDGWDVTINDNMLVVIPSDNAVSLATLKVSANDDEAANDDQKMTRNVNLCASSTASGIVNVAADEDEYVVSEIYSVDGTLVQKGGNVSSLPKGVYIVKMKSGDKVKSKKVVNK